MRSTLCLACLLVACRSSEVEGDPDPGAPADEAAVNQPKAAELPRQPATANTPVRAEEPLPPEKPLPPVAEPPSPPQLEVEPAPPLSGDPVALYGAADIACAVRHEAPVACFGGLKMVSTIKKTRSGDFDRPVALDTFESITNLAATNASGRCLLEKEGRLSCWMNRAPGPSPFGFGATPQPVELPAPVRSVAMAGVTCSVLVNGQTWCWGGNYCGERGDSSPSDDFEARLVERPNDATSVAATSMTTCVVTSAGAVECWGPLLVDDPRTHTCTMSAERRPIPGLDRVAAITMGDDHACALRSDGRVLCWGLLRGGKASPFPDERVPEPRLVPGFENVVEVAASRDNTCALHGDGTVSCFGELTERIGPVEIGGKAIDILVLNKVACALLEDHRLVCFGPNLEEYKRHAKRSLGILEPDAWRSAPSLWPDAARASIVAMGIDQTATDHLEAALERLGDAVVSWCSENDCRKSWPPEIVAAPDAPEGVEQFDTPQWRALLGDDRSKWPKVWGTNFTRVEDDKYWLGATWKHPILPEPVVLEALCLIGDRDAGTARCSRYPDRKSPYNGPTPASPQ